MKRLRVNAGKEYDIVLGSGVISTLKDELKPLTNAKKICIVSDTNVAPLYLDRIKSQLENEFEIYDFIFKAGEESKTTNTVIEIVEYLAQNEFTRNDIIIALGGGVCGDMAGFASAIYLRGIDFVQLPTSLLAQVDSSVGGKTAVDLPQGKNLCGAFHQPILVLIDTDTLKTLEPHYFSDGMAEAIKMGCIKSKSLFEKIEGEDINDIIEDVIFECVSLKAQVVERDEKEHGERALLNFGHTAGHAIEKLHSFKDVSHGEAVGMGMVLITKVCEKHSLTKKGTSERIENVLKKFNLKTSDTNSLDDIITAMNADKKRTGSAIKFIFIKDIGEGYINPVENEKIKGFFTK